MTRTRRIAGWLTGTSIAMSAGAVLGACPVCFRIDDGPTTAGIRAAVVVLIGVTTCVLSAFAVFIARFVRRASRTTLERAGEAP